MGRRIYAPCLGLLGEGEEGRACEGGGAGLFQRGLLYMVPFLNQYYQGATPLMFACGTGLADCVQMLAGRNADFNQLDGSGRGCLQLARQCQGNGQVLAQWLRQHVTGIAPSKNTAWGCVGVRGSASTGAGGRGWVLASVGACVRADVCGCRSSSGSRSGSLFGCGCMCVSGRA